MNRPPAAVALVAFAALIGTGLLLPAQESQDKVAKILDRIEELGEAGLWEGSRDLDALGRGAADEVRKGLTRANPFVRIAAARSLYGKELREEALAALAKVITGKNAAARRIAADVAGALVAADTGITDADRKRAMQDFEKQAAESEDMLAQVALWRAHHRLVPGNMKSIRAVQGLFSKADRREVKEEAALVLAEMDRFGEAKPVLVELAKEPSERGRSAAAYLKLQDLVKDIRRDGASAPKYDFKQLEEAIDALKSWYHDESKIVPDKLVEAAVRGACASLDPYTIYMDEAAINQLKEEDLGGKYGGIGARVAMRKDKAGNAWLTIEEPIFSGAAYRNGLRSNDKIIEIEGESTANKELYELVKRLRGKAGTPVKFKVVRRGWTKEREFVIVREQIRLETTIHRMLPGGIGYIRLTTFGEQDIELVEKAVKDMPAMKALVFDLRGNSGGYLRTARKIASYFLEPGKEIVSTRARGKEMENLKADGSKLTDVPLVMLVDDGSASASEILAGALQDHKRALLVGERTYGKGSVQDIKFLETTGKKSGVKITISKWYLPSGRTVEKEKEKVTERGVEKATEGGVEPDVKVVPPERDFWRDAEFERLRAGDDIEKYIKGIEDLELLQRIAESDGGDLSIYPGLDALVESLKTKASKEDVRDLVREQIRKRVQDEILRRPIYVDLQADVVLQRGVLEACRKGGVDAKGVREYSTFAKAADSKPTAEKQY